MDRTRTRFSLALLLATAASGTAGCGILNIQRTVFPNAAITDDGRGLYLDDINAIVEDPSLTADEKRQALRDLGIEDELLIDALLS